MEYRARSRACTCDRARETNSNLGQGRKGLRRYEVMCRFHPANVVGNGPARAQPHHNALPSRSGESEEGHEGAHGPRQIQGPKLQYLTYRGRLERYPPRSSCRTHRLRELDARLSGKAFPPAHCSFQMAAPTQHGVVPKQAPVPLDRSGPPSAGPAVPPPPHVDDAAARAFASRDVGELRRPLPVPPRPCLGRHACRSIPTWKERRLDEDVGIGSLVRVADHGGR